MAKKKEKQPESILESALKHYEETKKSLETKKYAVTWKKSVVGELKDYFENEISWKFNESIGVEKAYKLLNDAIATYSNDCIMLDSLTVQALYVFLSRKEGKGYAAATHYYNEILKPISESLKRIKADEASLMELESQIAEIKVTGQAPTEDSTNDSNVQAEEPVEKTEE